MFPTLSNKGSNFIYVNQADRTSATQSSSNFTVRFDDINAGNESNLSIQNIIIPRTFYSINSTNNIFTVNSTSVTLAVGNYTSATFVTELKSKLDALALGTFTVT